MTSPMHSPLQSPLQPVMRSPLEFRRRGGFNPVSALFGAGQQGVLYDPSVMSSLFQDSAGTIPVTAADQTVGKMLDLSGNGNHAIQADASKRPILRTDGTLWWLELDGVNDYMSTAAIDFSGTDKISVWCGVTKVGSATSILFENADTYSVPGSYYLVAPDAPGTYSFNSKGTAAISPGMSATATGYPEPSTNVVHAVGNISAGANSISVDGGTPITALYNLGSGNYGSYPLHIGVRNGAFLFFNGNLYPTIIAGALYDANTVAKMNAWTAKKTGVVL